MGKYKHLTDEEAEFFLEHGYLVVKHAFSRAKAESFTENLWVRLGLDASAPERWDQERVHMPVHVREPVASFAPKVWEIMKELLGGEDRIDAASSTWGDSFIVNLGPPTSSPSSPSSPVQPLFESARTPAGPAALNNWHVDGDFFVHFLDSPEQALLVTPIFSSIEPGGGATYIAPRSVRHVARYLAQHPEGVVAANLSFIPATSQYARPGAGALTPEELKKAREECGEGFWSHLEKVREMEEFVELTGEVGDVVLMHPLMMHSASRNELPGTARVITNPPVALKEPFCFARPEGKEGEYSLVERATLRALGVDRFEFEIKGERRSVVPARVAKQAALLEEEKRRIEARRAADANINLGAGGAVAIAVA